MLELDPIGQRFGATDPDPQRVEHHDASSCQPHWREADSLQATEARLLHSGKNILSQ